MKNILYYPAYMWHSFIVMWRAIRGRWYYMRDRPTWFVEEFANIPTEGIDQDDYQEAIAMVNEARRELVRRTEQLLREAQNELEERSQEEYRSGS